MFSRPSVLIFDVDGTLADTERDGHRVAFNLAFRDHGLDWDWSPELYGQLLKVTGGKERIIHFLNNYLPSFQTPELEKFVAQLHAAKTKHYMALLAAGRIPLRAGVKRLLQEAREAGLRLAIATTTTPVNVTGLLENSLAPDAVSWFEVIGAGDVVPAKKPAPDIFHYVLKEMNVNADDCIVFEDSANGLLAAQAAGLKTIVTISDYSKDDNFDGALLVVDSLGEPEAPCRSLSGVPCGEPYINLPLLHRLCNA